MKDSINHLVYLIAEAIVKQEHPTNEDEARRMIDRHLFDSEILAAVMWHISIQPLKSSSYHDNRNWLSQEAAR